MAGALEHRSPVCGYGKKFERVDVARTHETEVSKVERCELRARRAPDQLCEDHSVDEAHSAGRDLVADLSRAQSGPVDFLDHE